MRGEDQDRRGGALTRRGAISLIGGMSAAALGLPALAGPRRGGVLRVSAPTNPSSLDPVTGGAGSDHVFLFSIYDTLVEWEFETLTAKPGLAQSWTYPDPKTLVLELRQGVVFHDGTPFDAAAVKQNLDRIRTDPRSNIKADLVTVESVEATAPYQVTLRLNQPDSALPLILSDRAGMMTSPTAVRELGKDHDRKPVGTGAWKFVSWNDNDRIVVTRNEKYWKPGQPLLDGIEFAIIAEINTGVRSLIGGQNDFIYFLRPQQKQIISRAKGFSLATGPTLYCVQLYLNFGKPPFNDLRVRRAINLAIDRDALNKAAMLGTAEIASTALPRGHWAFDPALAGYHKHDPEEARRLLAEAGHRDGLDIHFVGYSDQRAIQSQEVLIEQLAKVGMRARVTTGSIPEISAGFFGNEKKGDMLLAAWTGRPDPSLTFSLMFAKDAYYNAGRAEVSPELSRALLESRSSQDLDERRKAFARVQRLVLENALVVPLYFQPELVAFADRVKGFRVNLLGKSKFEGVYLEGSS